MNLTLILQELVIGITTGAIYALIALGYTMVYGIIELINFAHGDIFMIGTMMSITIFDQFGITSTTHLGGIPLVGILLLTCLISMLVENGNTHHGADHENIAVGEINQLDNA